MSLGPELRSPRLASILGSWRALRAGRALPSTAKIMAEVDALGGERLGAAVIELRSPPALIVEASNAALDERLGFAATGADLLDLMPASERAVRYSRHCEIVTSPCGFFWREWTTEGQASEALFLPVDGGDTNGPRVLVAIDGLSAFNGYPEDLLAVDDIGWVDLGEGIPPSLYGSEPRYRASRPSA